MASEQSVWLVSVKADDRTLIVVSEHCVKAGDAVQIAFQVAGGKPILGEVIAAIKTDRGSELHKWVVDATERNVDYRKVVKVWDARQEKA